MGPRPQPSSFVTIAVAIKLLRHASVAAGATKTTDACALGRLEPKVRGGDGTPSPCWGWLTRVILRTSLCASHFAAVACLLAGNLRPMYQGADCSQRVCPYGDSHEYISDVGQQLLPVLNNADAKYAGNEAFVGFLPAMAGSAHHVHAFLNNGFLLNRDLGVDVKVVSVAYAASELTFQWKLNTEKTFNPQQTLTYSSGTGAYLSRATAYHIRPDLGTGSPVDSGLYFYFDLTATDFTVPTLYAGDLYYFNVSFNEGKAIRSNDDNTVHPLMECSGRGVCDRTSGVCGCTTGYTGDACQRTLCPVDCSGHGTCQSLGYFYDEGRGGNSDVYGGIEGAQQYGCKCDNGFRGSACEQSEWAPPPPAFLPDSTTDTFDYERAWLSSKTIAASLYCAYTSLTACVLACLLAMQLSAPPALTPWAAMAARREWTAPAEGSATTPPAAASASRASLGSAARSRPSEWPRPT